MKLRMKYFLAPLQKGASQKKKAGISGLFLS